MFGIGKKEKEIENLTKIKAYELFEERFSTWKERVIDVEQRVKSLELSEKNFRDKVLRKIQKSQDLEEEEQTPAMEQVYGARMLGGGRRR